MNTMKFELKQHFQIESARFLPHLPKEHPCSRMHGHSFKIILTLVGDLDPKIGWVIDYNDIQAAMKPLLEQIDHRVLNEVEGLENPTSELLAVWLYERARKVLPQLTKVTIAETPLTECSYPI
ncbi:6-pyruvoyltetrahydropterin synthase [Bdellovibrio bacteriovorus W]|nr:6-pyruvoyltetrahydropterin synthase [Bdellovibrio bacteriovorus W]